MLSFVTSVSIEKTLEAEIRALPPHDQAQVDAILHNIRDCLSRLSDNLLSAELVCVPVGDLLFWLIRRQAGGLNWALVRITESDPTPDQPPTGELLSSVADIFAVERLDLAIARIEYAYAFDLEDLPAAYIERTSDLRPIIDVQLWNDIRHTSVASTETDATRTAEDFRSLLAGLVTTQNSNGLRLRELLAPALAATDEPENAFVRGADTPVPADHDLNLSDKP